MGKQRLEMDKKLDTGEEPAKRRIDLSVAQVAGSAVAAVVAAVLASKLGVYGTVIGAGVVSVVATSGGTIFQHVFKRTGEQIREVTVHAKPKNRPPHGEGTTDATRVLRTVEVPTGLGDGQVPSDGGFSEATVHGTRVRGWKRSAIGAAVVFAIAMGGITAYEVIAKPLDGRSKPAIEGVFTGNNEKRTPPAEQPPASRTPEKDTTGGTGQTPDKGTGEKSPDPTTGTTGGKETPDPSVTPTPDPTTGTGGTTGDGGTTGGETPKPPSPTKAPDGGGAQDGKGQQGGAEGVQGRQQAPVPPAGANEGTPAS
ncbi:hypothetical protein OG897_19595 [Streptomyces sp. NBC_00237]|uniref:hypothetical protein n=1 Tax=Streptomyces sp. NBC_00237 TaxID=2975687 RepID=UPI00225C30BF|nr:hypothetical protein [Streptomyces sp. NBC_00237]MCX5203647.1 hypothetical protein [Streptomyces sp. NBC_00237]